MPSGTAERALDFVMADPKRARVLAESARDSARRDGDPASEVLAERVLGLAARELHDAEGAAAHLRRAVRLGERYGLVRPTAEARMSLALVVDDLGRPAAAIREVDRAIADLRGLPLARARMQRAIILRRLGREPEALATYGAALAAFRRWGDRLWQARALTNRGVLHAYRGALRQADADLHAAERLYLALDQAAAVAQVRHNRGFVAAQAGDVPGALTWYDRADEHFRRNGRPAVALLDRAELLLNARLLPEARQAAEAAVRACVDAGLGALLPQARLLVAQVALAAGDPASAGPPAQAARRAFQRQGRTRWAVLAGYVAWSASDRRLGVAAACRIARALAGAGWPVQALEALLAAPTPVVDRGAVPARLSAAERTLVADLAAAAGSVRRGSVRQRVRAWHADAMVRLAAGDRAGASRALLRGLRLLDEYRAALGATELRVHSAAEGTELATLGLRLALADRADRLSRRSSQAQSRQVLAWAERWRAATLRLPPPPPGYGDALARDLARLRRVRADLSTAEGDPQRLRQLFGRQRALEDAVRRSTWRLRGEAGQVGDWSVDDLCAAVDGHALVELVELDGELLALVVAGGRVSQIPLSRVDAVEVEVVGLRFALRRLALRHGTPASLAAAGAAAAHAAGQLDELILGPLRRLIGNRPLVVVPTGALHSLPWPILPTCRSRPLVLAPSGLAWWRAHAAPATVDGRVLLVAAASPPHAAREVATIAAELPGAATLTGDEAQVGEVLTGLDGASVAHLAAHGEFRADNPLFSHLLLADGPMTVYDLMRVRRLPPLVVLSACDTGLSTVHPGDELMGLASALLGLGTRTLVASVGPVDDAATRTLMVDLHRRLRAGTDPAEALAAAQSALTPDPRDVETASLFNFLCLGAG